MLEAIGNLWTNPSDAVVITTNGDRNRFGECVMGRGCAREAKQKFPGIANQLGGYILAHGNRAFILKGWPKPILTMPVKHHWHEEADIELIKRSCDQLLQIATQYQLNQIVIPRPGCGNGRLDWLNVKPTIARILDDRFTAITH